MKKIVWRDASGRVINIGPWDEQCELVASNPVPDGVGLSIARDGRMIWSDGDGSIVHVGEWDLKLVPGAPTNPVPTDATSGEEEVVEGWDGGLYAADDPRRSRGVG